jgi:hypothetical protein
MKSERLNLSTNDFEVHPIGTAEEIKLSRQLCAAVAKTTYLYGDVSVTEPILKAYKKLTDYYDVQIGRENV